jgi:hypothetical protein
MAMVLVAMELDRAIAPLPESELAEDNFRSVDTILALIAKLRG